MEQDRKQTKDLYRSKSNRILFGVCGGLGEYFGIDPMIFRIIFLALTFGAGWGILIYLVMAILIPSGLSEEDSGDIDLRKRANGLISELRDSRLSRSRNNWLGWIMIIFGSILLLDQILPRGFFNWNLFWALAIIVAGFFVLTRGESEEKNFRKEEAAPKEEIREPLPKTGMGVGRLFFGLLFLVVGFAFLARNLGWIPGFYVNIDYLFRFWPVLIIVLGLSFLSRGSRLATIFSLIFVIVIIIMLAVSLFFPDSRWFLEICNLVLSR